MWKEILFKIFEGQKNIPSPFSKDGFINYVFVLIDKENRMGFGWIWCSKTHTGINMSRMKIPENVQSVSSEEFSKMKLPMIEFVNPSDDNGGL
ncbi:hypothetical protein [Parafilimonas terrae]|uniref:Uncharacterized protein n=1 Tax=Parafilimonas terrae TaxID=1465490 RepID=A0A1I5ZIB9_9BACT|nr:hypothetical protein [Parafilimonas terrae]SFQ56150.1 hypothetical protein SAMN05444277_1332 [Parafilimonas terrae]